MKHFAILALLAALLGQFLTAQETGSPLRGFILNATGSGFSVYRQGVFSIHGSGSGEIRGFPLYAGDMLYTNADATLEIQLTPGTSRIQAGENTSFQFSAPGQAPAETRLQYGRLKIISDGLSPLVRNVRNTLNVLSNGPAVVCLDQFIDARGMRRNSIHVVDGEVNVLNPADVAAWLALAEATAAAPAGTGTIMPVYRLQAGKGVGLPLAESLSEEKKILAQNLNGILVEPYAGDQPDLNAYWNERPAGSRLLPVNLQDLVLVESPSWPKDEADQLRLARLIRALIDSNQEAAVAVASPANPGPATADNAPAEPIGAVPGTLEKTEPAPAAKKPALAPRLADSIAPLDSLQPAVVIRNPVHVIKQDQEKIAGIWMGLSGILLDVLGISLELYGNQVFGFAQADCDTTAAVLGGTGAGLLAGGLLLYLDGLFN